MTTDQRQQPGQLKPRAIAVLCTLRRGPMLTLQIAHAIGDAHIADTRALLNDMITNTIDYMNGDQRWYLTHDGIGWLQTNGLDAVQEARLWVAQERAS